MRVVVFGLRGFPGVQGGIEKHCEELYPRLAELGAEVTVVTRKRYMKKNAASFRGVSFIDVYAPKNKFMENIVHSVISVFLLGRLRPDIVHIHSIGSSLVTPLVRLVSRGKYKIVVTNHGPDYMRKKWNFFARFMLKKGEKYGVFYSNAMICVAKWIRDYIREKYGKDSYYIPNGITLPEENRDFVPGGGSGGKVPVVLAEAAGAGVKAEEKPVAGSGKNPYILTVTRFVPEKGVTDLIEAFGGLKGRFHGEGFGRLGLTVVGKADHPSEYSERILEMSGATPGVKLAGALYGKELYDMFAGASLFVLPSYYEGLPLVLLEALGFGIPVLVSDIKAHREFGLDGSRYFEPGNPDDLSEKMKECLERGMTDAERVKYLELVKSEYDWDRIASMTFRLYGDLAG